MEKRFLVFPKVGQKLHHILQIPFGLNGFIHIAAGTHQLVLPGGVLQDLPLFHGLHQPVVDPKRHAIAVSKLGKDGLFLGGGRVLPDGPHAAVTVSNDIVVGKELDGTRQDAVEEVLGADFLHLLRCQHLGFSFEHFLPPCRRFAPARGSEKAALPDAKRPIVDWLFRFRSHNEQTPIPAG